jgi:hypothetical protein
MSHATISFYVVVSLAWATALLLMAILVHPAVASRANSAAPTKPIEAPPTALMIHELAGIFPPLDDSELQDLADDIRKNGLRDPWSKTAIPGRREVARRRRARSY